MSVNLQQIVEKIENGEEVTREELELRGENQATPFLYACWNSTNAVLEQVLDKMKQVGFKPNEIKGQKQISNRSGIHEAAQSWVDSKAKVETLVLKHGFDVNESAGSLEYENSNSNEGFDQDTPIVAAHNQYNLDTIAFLYENGVKEVLTQYDRNYFEDIINGVPRETALQERAKRKAAVNEVVNGRIGQNNYTRSGIKDKIKEFLGPGYGGRKKTKKRKLNKRKKTQKKLKKKQENKKR